MIILSHRGWWRQDIPKNSVEAFDRSIQGGFGTETDIRDSGQLLVVSHDPPTADAPSIASLLERMDRTGLPLAINIKADGLAEHLDEVVKEYEIANWFAFDMSIPDMRAYLDKNMPVFARVSEVEQRPVWPEFCRGIWLDAFDRIWYDQATLLRILREHGDVCVVSEELHERSYEEQWELLYPVREHDGLMLCTDFPDLAQEYFR